MTPRECPAFRVSGPPTDLSEVNDMEYVCEACGTALEDRATLRQHQEQVHGGIDGSDLAKDSDATGGTTTSTAGGASRVQTE